MTNIPNPSEGIPPHKGSVSKLVDANRLLETIWDEKSRPSLRWLRERQAQRAIPFVKVGARVWFDPQEVRKTLKERWTVRKIKK